MWPPGHVELVRLLLRAAAAAGEKPAVVDARDCEGVTPMLAAVRRQLRVAKAE